MVHEKLLIALSAILVINGCSNWQTQQPTTVTETRYIEQDIPVIERPRPVQLNDVKWYVVTEENYDDFVERFTQENQQLVFVALSVEDYETLAVNLEQLRRFINQQKQVIVYYETALQ